MKKCAKCRKTKPFTDFSVRAEPPHYPVSQCKSCRNAYFRKRYANLSPAQRKRRLQQMLRVANARRLKNM